MIPPSCFHNFGFNWEEIRPTLYIKSSEQMAEVGNATVDLVVTSPPYGSIKDYGIAGQIGFFDSFEDYFARLTHVWGECWRVLKPGSRLVVNVGDQYLRKTEHGQYRIVPIGAQITLDCQKLGFLFLGDVIWQKVSTTNTTGGCSLMGSLFYPNNGLFTFDYEHVLIFKKEGDAAPKVSPEMREFSKIPLDEWKRWFTGHWRFPGIVQKEHVAMFPEELPHRIIRMFSAVGDTVLDPFAGSGTTLKVAWSLLRQGIGFEINPAFEPIIQQKITEARPNLFPDYQFLLNALSSIDVNRFDIDLAFSKQKGVTCFHDKVNDTRFVLDYLLLDKQDGVDVMSFITKKMEENSFQNYQKNVKDWANVNLYVIAVNPSLPKPVQLPPCPRPYHIANYENLVSLTQTNEYIEKVLSSDGSFPTPSPKSASRSSESLSGYFPKKI